MTPIIVTTTRDVIDADDGLLSLREAILLANADEDAHTITFDESVFDGDPGAIIRLTLGELVITRTLTIVGGSAGVTITGDANGDDTTLPGGITDVAASAGRLSDNSRIFHATAGDLTLIGLTLTGGRTTADFERGGAVRALGTLTLTDVTVAGGSTEGRFASGGGIAGAGVITVTNSTLSGNLTEGRYANGGGVSGVDVRLTNATVAFNRTLGFEADGGGVFGTDVTLVSSTATGNVTAGDFASGGGVYGFRSVTLTDSIVLGNVAASSGDEVSLNTLNLPATLTLTGAAILGRDGGGGADVFAGGAAVGDTSAAAVFAATVDIGGGVLAGVLADNGGPVPTVALRPDALNPALDASEGGAVTADARGVEAVDLADVGATGAGAAVRDLGAFEVTALPETPSLVVTTALDVVDAFDGLTSLREAILFANANPGADTITFAPALAGGFLRLTQGELLITDALTISGGPAGVTISGDRLGNDETDARGITDVEASGAALSDNSRIFHATADLALEGLTLTGGQAFQGGAVRSTAALSVTDSTLAGNLAAYGGAVFASGQTELTRSVVADNRARGDDFAWGGGVLISGGSLVAADVSFIGNAADGRPNGDLGAANGGGLFFGGANLTLTNATFADNRVFGERSTSLAGATDGAAIAGSATGVATMTNATVTGNVAQFNGEDDADGAAISWRGGAPLTAASSIVTGNSGETAQGGTKGVSFVGSNIVDGRLFVAGAEVRAVAAAEIFAETAAALPARINTATGGEIPALLAGVAADNGGPVPTVALLDTLFNPAVDAAVGGPATAADARGVLAFDQPGVGGAARDLGAFEIGGLLETPSLVVTTAADVVDGLDGVISLREAIFYADSLPGVQTITFDPTVFDGGADAIIRLGELGTLRVAGDLVIDGGPRGVTITGDRRGDDVRLAGGPLTDVFASRDAGTLDDNVQLFRAAGDIAVVNLTLTGGRATGELRAQGGAIEAAGTITVTGGAVSGNIADAPLASAGGGLAAAHVVVTDSTVSGNFAVTGSGGGIFAGASALVTGSTIDGNAAGLRGGGIYGATFAAVTVRDSVVSDNVAGGNPQGGGGVHAWRLTVEDSTVSGNGTTGSSGNGGGLYSLDMTVSRSTISGNFTTGIDARGGGVAGIGVIVDSTITGNSTTGLDADGGGVAGPFTLTNTTVSGNFTTGAFADGGGLASGVGLRPGPITLINSTVTGNVATASGGGVAGPTILVDSIVLGNAASLSDDEIATVNNLRSGGGQIANGDVTASGRNIVGADAAAFDASGFPAIENADPTLVFARTATLADGTVAGALADNGGPVATVGLKADAANPALDAALGGTVDTDARGVAAVDLPGVGAAGAGAAVRDLGAYELAALPEPPPPAGPITLGFRVLPVDTNGEEDGGNLEPGTEVNRIDAAWILPRDENAFQQLLALVDSDPDLAEPAFGGGFDRAFNLASMEGNGKVVSLALDNGPDDPVLITASGRTGPAGVGDLTGEVRFTNERGFGLQSQGDTGPNHGFLNRGEAIDFQVQGQLLQASFTVQTRDARQLTTLALDVDGDTMTNPSGRNNAFVTDALVQLTGLANGSRIDIDFAEAVLSVNGVARNVDDAFWLAFADAGADNLTIGTRHDESRSFAIADLLLVVDDGGLIA